MKELPFFDWNGNGRIDPQEIALSPAIDGEDREKDDGEEEKEDDNIP